MVWRAYIQGAGGAAYLHIKQGDEEAERLVLEILHQTMDEDYYGIESVYTRNELDKFHADQSVRYMLEAKNGYCFDDSLLEPVISDLEEEGIKYATHGFSPDKPNYKCNLVVSGEKIKSGYPIGDIKMVDIAPTMAKVLGIDFNTCDGRVLKEIFDK
jgi:predicted AlkP superfamily pyrophosphatase or phosphodiesterase